MRALPFEIEEPADLYEAIHTLRTQHVEPPFMFVFESREEIEALFEGSLPEDRIRFFQDDILLIYVEREQQFVYPSGHRFELNGHQRSLH